MKRVLVVILGMIAVVSVSFALEYAMSTTEYGVSCAEIRSGSTPFPEGSVYPVMDQFRAMQSKDMIITNGELRAKTDEEKVVYQTAYSNHVKQTMDVWQGQKDANLKFLESQYSGFLTNNWTTILQSFNVIDTNTIVTIETPEATNIAYLIQLKDIGTTEAIRAYLDASSQFSTLKFIIEQKTIDSVGKPPDGSTILSNVKGL